jgi:hypothetical protein
MALGRYSRSGRVHRIIPLRIKSKSSVDFPHSHRVGRCLHAGYIRAYGRAGVPLLCQAAPSTELAHDT